MKKLTLILSIFLVCLLSVNTCEAAWVWSPDIGKWINPKKAAKDTPEDQFAWAMQFYNKKDFDRSTEEFEKLANTFPNSRLAAESVYYTGLSWEERKDPAKAADNYQKLIDRYPYSDRIKDAVAREFEIADGFAKGDKIKVVGLALLSGQEKAVELYKHIVKNAPFGTFGDQAQYKIGEVYEMQGEYELAEQAFQAVIDEYPDSPLVSKAKYQIAHVTMQASQKSRYNEDVAQKAIEEFKGFKEAFPDDKQGLMADEAIKALRTKKAETDFSVAEFYDKQNKTNSAKVYYRAVAEKYPDTPSAEKAKKRLEELTKAPSTEAPKKGGMKLWPW